MQYVIFDHVNIDGGLISLIYVSSIHLSKTLEESFDLEISKIYFFLIKLSYKESNCVDSVMRCSKNDELCYS